MKHIHERLHHLPPTYQQVAIFLLGYWHGILILIPQTSGWSHSKLFSSAITYPKPMLVFLTLDTGKRKTTNVYYRSFWANCKIKCTDKLIEHQIFSESIPSSRPTLTYRNLQPYHPVSNLTPPHTHTHVTKSSLTRNKQTKWPWHMNPAQTI